MTADFHIHVLEGVTNQDVDNFLVPVVTPEYRPHWRLLMERIARTPNIWVGEVSWLGAAITEDESTSIPDTIMALDRMLQTRPKLTPELERQILATFTLPNHTDHYRVADVQQVAAFLARYRGKQLFAITW